MKNRHHQVYWKTNKIFNLFYDISQYVSWFPKAKYRLGSASDVTIYAVGVAWPASFHDILSNVPHCIFLLYCNCRDASYNFY